MHYGTQRNNLQSTNPLHTHSHWPASGQDKYSHRGLALSPATAAKIIVAADRCFAMIRAKPREIATINVVLVLLRGEIGAVTHH
jgi:hypothetical protein